MVKADCLYKRGQGVKPHGGHNFCLRHIGQSHAAMWRPRIGPPHAQSASSQLPSHCLYYHVTIHTSSHHMPAWIRTTTCHPFSGATWHPILPNFPVSSIQQNTVTFSYGVRLRWNERRWNRLNEPFDLMLVLLILEDFKILPSWILLDHDQT